MNIDKKEIKKTARGLAFFVMGHQIFFQIGAMILVIITTAALSLIGMQQLEDAALYIASDLMQVVAGIFFLVFYLVNRRKINATPMKNSKCTPKLFEKCIAAIFAVNMMLSLIEMLLVTFTGFSLSVPMESVGNMNPVLLFVTVAVFPAVVEELLYRGVLYRYLRGHGIQFAAITSSVIFGLIHLNFMQFLFATIMGVVCCYIYEATGKIRYSMVLHLLNNSILVVFSVLPLSDFGNMIIQFALGVISFVATIAYLIYRKKKHGALKTDISPNTKKCCLYFFTSIPMLVFVLTCLCVCVLFAVL